MRYGSLKRLVFAAVALTGANAHAQTPVQTSSQAPAQTGDARAAAFELFTQGRALLEQEDYPRACAKFEESQRLDPGGGTLLNLALCHEKMGRTASAWVELAEALRVARLDGRADREELARSHVEALKPKLARLRIAVEGRAEGLVVKRDGVAMGEAAWNEAVPVDPGTHVIAASAPGRAPWRAEIAIDTAGNTETVRVPALTLHPIAIAPVTVAPAPDDARASDAPRSPVRTAGLVVGGVGIAGLGTAAALFFVASGKASASDRECPAADLCSRRGVELNHQAGGLADASTAFAIGGAAMLATGAALFFFAPRHAAPVTCGRVVPGIDSNGARVWFVSRF
jgi:hypothetical protein